MTRAAAGFAILALALAGCAGVRPTPPPAAAIQPPAAWRTAADPGAPAAAGWWASFGDPALSAVVETALAHNTDIAAAAARVEEARAQYRLAQAQRLPNLTGVAGGGRQRDVSAFGTPREQTAGQAQLQVAYDTDLFGRLASASAAARAALLASEAGRDGVRLAVAASAASGYINLRALDARLTILRSTLEARADSLNLARRRAEAGYAPRLDQAQAEAEYHAAEQLIPATQAAIARQENGLALLLGDSPRAITRGADLAELAPPPVPAGLPADLLRRRPDLVQAEDQLVAADRSLDSARAAFLPSVQLTAAAGYAASSLLDDPIRLFSLGGSVLAPILDAGRLNAQQGAAAARRDQAAFAYRKAALTAFREVDDALSAERRTAEQAADIVAQRAALAQVLTLATNRYRAGYSPYLEQLDAQRSLLAADLSLVQVRADRLTAAVSLYQTLGGGWTSAQAAAVGQ
ncbi:efflux transporter outer membrane subunit [Phenylobacterium sp.]|uniref:efflux transporter outer membrane subunit n=1 Tax=Phenylobacterium sp. TaxID=1871053 RepID=UPI0025E5CB92|nr:efflux transporter outer membrane subunit [Phenylobacterium sp.]